MSVVKVTKIRKEKIILPGETEVFQSNRITEGRFVGFTLIQSRVLVCIMKQLQVPIKSSMSAISSGTEGQQLEMFKLNTVNSESMQIAIPLKEIGKPFQYKEIYESIEQMMSLKIKVKPLLSKENFKIAVLINAIEMSKKINGTSVVFIQIMREVANELIYVEKNIKGQPIYTKYLYEVAMNASNKYTYKLYWLISSWKVKGGFHKTLKELYNFLGISDDEYPEYTDFKRRVLIPIQKDLEKKSDCWFNCKEKGFEVKNGRKVIALNFKIIVPILEEQLNERKDYIRNLLIMHYGFKETHINALQPILGPSIGLAETTVIINKMLELRGVIEAKQGTKEQVNDIATYTLTSLLKILKP